MNSDEQDDFDLAFVVRLIGRYRWLIGGLTLAFGVLMGVISFNTRPYFKSEVSVTEVRQNANGSLGALASSLGGLASIAGVSLGGAGAGGTTPGQEAAAVLESHRVAEEFIRRNNLIPVILKNPSKPPTMWMAVKEFLQRVVTIRKDPRKGVTTVGMQWTDPAVAAQWANQYIALTNELIRARALQESSRNITYLNTQLAKTDSVELRKVLYTLIENETKTLMIANGRTEYAFQVVDPAVPPELKEGPHRLLNTLVGLMLGFILGGLAALIHDRIARMRASVHKVNAPGRRCRPAAV